MDAENLEVSLRCLIVFIFLVSACSPYGPIERDRTQSPPPITPEEIPFPARILAGSQGLDGRTKTARADVVSRDFFIAGEDYQLSFGYYSYLVIRDRPSDEQVEATIEAVAAFFCETENGSSQSLGLVPPSRSVVLFAPLNPKIGRGSFVGPPDLVRFVENGYDFIVSRLWWNSLQARPGQDPLPSILIAAAPNPLFHQKISPTTLKNPASAEIELIALSGDPAQIRSQVKRFRDKLVLPENALQENGNILTLVRSIIAELANLVDPIISFNPSPRRSSGAGVCIL